MNNNTPNDTRLMVINKVLNLGGTQSDVARELNIPISSVNKWVNEARHIWVKEQAKAYAVSNDNRVRFELNEKIKHLEAKAMKLESDNKMLRRVVTLLMANDWSSS